MMQEDGDLPKGCTYSKHALVKSCLLVSWLVVAAVVLELVQAGCGRLTDFSSLLPPALPSSPRPTPATPSSTPRSTSPSAAR